MLYRPLKGTDLELSVLSFGTTGFIGMAKHPYSLEQGKAALNLALDRGVNCIHTAYEYGIRPAHTHNTRKAVGQWLAERGMARSVHHVIKVPCPDTNEDLLEFRPEYFRLRVEEALADLGAERIDLIQWCQRDGLDRDNPREGLARFAAMRDDLAAVFEALRDEGKVGHLGVFTYNDTFARAYHDSGLIAFHLFYHNVWDTAMWPFLKSLRDADTGAMVLCPFRQGLLTQKRADPDNPPAGDKFDTPEGREMLRLRSELMRRAGIETDDLTAYALRFALASPVVASVITGMNTTRYVEDMCRMIEGPLPSEEEVDRVHQAALEMGGPWITYKGCWAETHPELKT